MLSAYCTVNTWPLKIHLQQLPNVSQEDYWGPMCKNLHVKQKPRMHMCYVLLLLQVICCHDTLKSFLEIHFLEE